jgi:endonuclease III related protein
MHKTSLTSKKLIGLYQLLLKKIGPRHWWPADSPFEVMLGAILTQNTAWSNVEKAITNLKQHDLLSPDTIAKISEKKLAALIRSSGYYNQKAKKIKKFTEYLLNHYHGSIKKMSRKNTETLREELLSLYGIGPETADSILLYALNKPVFVVDTYTRRIFHRHGWIHENATYEEMQEFFMQRLPKDVSLFNQFHAFIVYIGHFYCRKTPRCDACPIKSLLPKKTAS